MSIPFAEQVQHYVERVDQTLIRALEDADVPTSLVEAMRYSATAGGKRVRPLLVYAAGSLFDANDEAMNAAAAAVEMIHCYSLIHDDLPAMDDDDLRRGRPTLHIQYDEATAILAGDSLQALAFEVITSEQADWPDHGAARQAVQLLARAAGGPGMVGGQMLDISYEGQYPSQADVERMFRLKTGALIRVSVQLGVCASAQASDEDRRRLTAYGEAIGQAFQIQDDVLDVVGSEEEIGKPKGSDEEKNKPNYALRFGLENAKARANELYEQAMDSLSPYGEQAEGLRWLANFIIRRSH